MFAFFAFFPRRLGGEPYGCLLFVSSPDVFFNSSRQFQRGCFKPFFGLFKLPWFFLRTRAPHNQNSEHAPLSARGSRSEFLDCFLLLLSPPLMFYGTHVFFSLTVARCLAMSSWTFRSFFFFNHPLRVGSFLSPSKTSDVDCPARFSHSPPLHKVTQSTYKFFTFPGFGLLGSLFSNSTSVGELSFSFFSKTDSLLYT